MKQATTSAMKNAKNKDYPEVTLIGWAQKPSYVKHHINFIGPENTPLKEATAFIEL